MKSRFTPATREGIYTQTSFAGSTGSGKTLSLLRYATGLAAGGKIAFIDTEAGRGKHYAGYSNPKIGINKPLEYDYTELKAPFTPDAYKEAVTDAEQDGYSVIIMDSISHEHAGEGGLLDWHEKELNRMAGDDWKKREACKMTAWIKPKMSHKAMMTRFGQVRAHLLFGLRAEEKMQMSQEIDPQTQRKKTVIVPAADRPIQERWQPICEKNFMYEMVASFVLTAANPGVPIPVKLQDQHKHIFNLDKPVTEECGALMAAWARGDKPLTLDDMLTDISIAPTAEGLEFKFKAAYKAFSDAESRGKIVAAKDKRKEELTTVPTQI